MRSFHRFSWISVLLLWLSGLYRTTGSFESGRGLWLWKLTGCACRSAVWLPVWLRLCAQAFRTLNSDGWRDGYGVRHKKQLCTALAQSYLGASWHWSSTGYFRRMPGLLQLLGFCQNVLEGSYRCSCCKNEMLLGEICFPLPRQPVGTFDGHLSCPPSLLKVHNV